MIHLLFNAFLLGLVGGFVPGPMLTMGFSEGVRGGFKSGLKVIAWALIAESIVAAIILVFFSFIPKESVIFLYIGIIGGFLLIYFSYSLFKIKQFSLESEKLFFSTKKLFYLHS